MKQSSIGLAEMTAEFRRVAAVMNDSAARINAAVDQLFEVEDQGFWQRELAAERPSICQGLQDVLEAVNAHSAAADRMANLIWSKCG
jgi:hypothetical protein